MRKVIKRDGRAVKFEDKKIRIVLGKILKSVGNRDGDLINKLMGEIKRRLVLKEILTVELIQDTIEETLLENALFKEYRSMVVYREKHKENRSISSLLNPIPLIDSYLGKDDWEIRENSNMSFSVQGLNNYVTKKIIRSYWLNKIYSDEIKEAHRNGDLHIHDLDFLGAYCVGWDLKDLLIRGFGGVEGKVGSKPAKHFSSILGQMVNFIYTLQGEAAGAQAFSNVDTYLAPFIYYDHLSYEEVKQNIQEFIYNMNVPTRVGFQSPFSNITLDLKIPEFMKNEAVIIGGKLEDRPYAVFQKEMYMFDKAFFEVMMEGDAKGRPFTFPIPTINIDKEFDWSNPNYAPLWKATGKYGIPYFSNFINSDMKPSDARSMCCRLRIDNRELRKRGGGLFGANPLTGSIGVVTINLPRIGYISHSKEEFFNRLEGLMEVARDSLIEKRKVIEMLTEKGLFPYSQVYLDSVKSQYGEYWKNHFSTIGIVGLNEASINLIRASLGTKKGQSFGIEVLDFMRKVLRRFQEETGNNYNIEATPAEGTSYSLALKDREYFEGGKLKFQGEGDNIYYTNSSQLPVGFTDDVFKALDFQDELQSRYTGGTVLHLFLGESITDYRNVRNLIKKVFENYKLPYISLTPTYSICPIHGFLKGEHFECPICKKERIEKIDEKINNLRRFVND